MNNTVRRAGYLAFFLSGICAISSGVIVSLLQENRGLDYSTVGTLLSVMSIGNLAAGLLTAVLPERFGLKPTVLLLTCGYALMLPHRSALLPAAGLGNILMPWLIGQVAEFAGLRIGMEVNILPCVGMLALAALLRHKTRTA